MIDAVQSSASLRRRLNFVLIGGAALLAILLFIVVRHYAALIAQQGQDDVLAASAASILDTALVRDDTLDLDFPYAALSMLNTASDDRVFYAVYRDNAFLSGYDDLPRRGPLTSDALSWTARYKGAEVRLTEAERPLVASAGPTVVTVAVAQTQDALAGTLQSISRTVALICVGFFLMAAALSFWATSTTIGPLNRLTQSVARRGPQDLSPVAKPVPAEMVPLVGSLNNLMGRLDASLKQSEDFIAEAAHRVRTPLATVRSHAEATLQRVEKEDNRQALRAMVRAIDESSRAAGQLLDHAMITFRADHLERQPLDLKEIVVDLLDRLEPVADMKDITFRIKEAGSLPVTGDPILLQNAIRNLLDNALKYAPAESDIWITLEKEPVPNVCICDAGHGFPADQIDGLVERFARGSNALGLTGSGLGLTIAQDVAVAHGGRLQLANRQEGGACVTFSL
ncbi:MAG: sensor histidine kinase N-terminal domain-containing protein [Pseudomonadota bacterium]